MDRIFQVEFPCLDFVAFCHRDNTARRLLRKPVVLAVPKFLYDCSSHFSSLLPHSHAAIEDALVRLTQREPLHRTTPVLLDFLRLLLSVSVFWQFGNEFIVLLQSDA